MWRSKVALIAMMMLLSMGFVLCPQDSANAAMFCAQLRGATAAGQPLADFERRGIPMCGCPRSCKKFLSGSIV